MNGKSNGNDKQTSGWLAWVSVNWLRNELIQSKIKSPVAGPQDKPCLAKNLLASIAKNFRVSLRNNLVDCRCFGAKSPIDRTGRTQRNKHHVPCSPSAAMTRRESFPAPAARLSSKCYRSLSLSLPLSSLSYGNITFARAFILIIMKVVVVVVGARAD